MAGIRLVSKTSLGKIESTLDAASEQSPNDLDLLAIRAANLARLPDAYLVARSMKDALGAAEEGMATTPRWP